MEHRLGMGMGGEDQDKEKGEKVERAHKEKYKFSLCDLVQVT